MVREGNPLALLGTSARDLDVWSRPFRAHVAAYVTMQTATTMDSMNGHRTAGLTWVLSSVPLLARVRVRAFHDCPPA